MYQLKGHGNHHQDHGSPFLPPSIELTSSAILDYPVDIFIDTQQPESIKRQGSPFSSCLGVPHHDDNHQWHSSCVPSALLSVSFRQLGILACICGTTVLQTGSAGLHFSTGFSLWECSCVGRGKT